MKVSFGIPLALLLVCAVLPWALGSLARVREGNCPDVQATCMMAKPPVPCDEDYACPGDQKCCEHACGTSCTDPVKLGECPDIKVRCMMENPPVLCRSDFACPGEQKCCELACGTNCTDPVIEKPGGCPVIKQRCMLANPPVLCHSDSACPGDQKCCELACGTNCTDPEKPGMCPHIEATCDMLNPPALCSRDSACPGKQKCCQLSCSTNCTDPIDTDGHNFKGYMVNCTTIPDSCLSYYVPVCTMDGITRDSECTMCHNYDESSAIMCVKHKGECGQKGMKLPCKGYPSDVCTMELMYHCGNNGVTYKNECDYCNRQVRDSSLRLLYRRHCYNGHPPCE